MNRRARTEEESPGEGSGRWAPAILAVGLGLWLGGFWYWSDSITHRWALLPLLLPGLVGNRRLLWPALRRNLWGLLVVILLAYQWLSRFWSAPMTEASGYWLDVLLVGALCASLLVLAQLPREMRRLFAALAVVAAAVASLSLLRFYGAEQHNLADDRLRNVLIYADGLNPVLTGLLCSFGALVAAWRAGESAGAWRAVWLVSLGILVFGILATQSRGAMLAYGAGFAILIGFQPRRALPALAACVVASVAFFALLARAAAGGEAARDLLARGATGRFEIYAWLLKQMHGADGIIGKGMGHPISIPEEEFGWFVEHPHSIYVTQYFLTGAIGAGLLLMILAMALQAAGRLAKQDEPLWLALLTGSALALLFDGGQVFSLFSIGRLEPLLVLVPACIAVGRAHGIGACGARGGGEKYAA